MHKLRVTALAVLAFGLSAAQAQSYTQGVSKNEIVIGSIQDLSGPIAGFGKQARNGMILAVDEINEQGGVNGRKLVLKVEDNAYDPKKAVLAAQKLVNQDKIFAMLGSIGTAHNMASMPVQFEKNVFNIFPLTSAREMYEPLHKFKYAFQGAYYDQIRSTVPLLIKDKDVKKVCVIYQDDEFGLEILRGTEDALKPLGMTVLEKTSFKRGATDFSSQVARLKSAGCELVALGTLIRETIGTVSTARKLGYTPHFIGSSGAYTDLIHKLGGPAMNGVYAGHTTAHPYLDDASQPIRFWASKYKTKFNEDPTVFSAYGYLIVNNFARAAAKAGANLTSDSMLKSLESYSAPADIFGTPALKLSPTNHLASPLTRVSQIVDGRWKVVYDYPQQKAAPAAKPAAKK